jgi:hypothetical protein
MRLVTRRRQLGGARRYAPGGLKDERGNLPSFSKPVGLDFVITPEGEAYLIELQHGFGRRGLLQLFPLASRDYRKTFWRLRRELGKSPWIAEGIRRICGDKIETYKVFAPYQPASLVYWRWSPKVERWLESLAPDAIVLAKPPRGSCGRGIVVLNREQLLQWRSEVQLKLVPVLLQEYIESRMLVDSKGQPHLGCIRHIVLMRSDSTRLSFIHLPSYWRVAPEPFVSPSEGHPPDQEALTANISRGAYPQKVSQQDARLVQRLSETICAELIQRILDLPASPPSGPSQVIQPDY